MIAERVIMGSQIQLISMILAVCLGMCLIAMMVFMGMYVYYTKRDKRIARINTASIRRQISTTGPHTRIEIA